MPNLSFAKLWNAYPSTSHPCTQNWPHQCSIRMSIALNHEGSIPIQPSTYTEPTCRHGHARGAESLANWLWKYHLGRPKIFNNGSQAKQAITKNTGIIFFKDCFIRPNSTDRSGDHIDLWNRGIPKEFSDPNNYASEVWFWNIDFPTIEGSWSSNFGCTSFHQNDDTVHGNIMFADGRIGHIQGRIQCRPRSKNYIFEYQYDHSLDQGTGELEFDHQALSMQGYFHSSLYGNSGLWNLATQNYPCSRTP